MFAPYYEGARWALPGVAGADRRHADAFRAIRTPIPSTAAASPITMAFFSAKHLGRSASSI